MSYRIDPHRPLTQEICRIGSGQIHEAIALLDEGRTKRDGGAHEARKRFKRLRGLLRLIAGAAPAFRHEQEGRVKEIANSLSAIRDATAIVETVDRFASEADAPEGIDHLMALRRGLLARRDRIVKKQGALDGVIDEAIAKLHECNEVFGTLILPDAPDEAAEILATGMEKICIEAQKALRKAAKRGHDEDFHELRKRVKYHEMHLQLLGGAWPKAFKERWKLAEKLGDELGDLHDIPVLAETIEAENIGGKKERKFAQKLMRKKRKHLRRDCLDRAQELFKATPEEIARGVAVHYAMIAAVPSPFPLRDNPPIEQNAA